MIIQGPFLYVRTIEDEGGQFKWLIMKVPLPGVLGTSTVFDQGVERTHEEAERKGDAVLKKIAAGLQEADASRGEKLDMSGGPYWVMCPSCLNEFRLEPSNVFTTPHVFVWCDLCGLYISPRQLAGAVREYLEKLEDEKLDKPPDDIEEPGK